ncbi:serine/threonine protein kinase [Alcanivorax sp. DP30]|uniref:serine/threonine protein kinase n=1 Tax=Alcanivorax sp. DP30 TaxID=2606217 RepID=UPI00136B2D0C|nr:serine/threonine protein kinase [Alcanivorax sp. DP30]MZR64349.1 serine/threonine protein kinase [Alcanivorax sp. DP30]
MSHPFDDLTPDFMLDAVDAAGFLSDGRLLQLNSFENRVYQVGQEEGPPVIVKFYRPDRWSDEQILEEHAFSLFLVERDLPVIAPEVRDGNSLFHCDGFSFSVFRRAGGHAPELANDSHLEQLGRTLARWHACGSDRPYQLRPTLDVIADTRAASRYLIDDVIDLNYRGQYRDLIGQLLEAIEQRLAGLSFPLLNVHGDCHTGNILWRDDSPHFVDLDDSLRAPAMQDLWMLLSGEEDEQQHQLRVLAQGYDTFLPFPWEQKALIEPLRIRRMVCYDAWLAKRWDDPAFPPAFPWFESMNYWGRQLELLQQQHQSLQM